MVSHVVMLTWLLMSMGVFFILEQPRGSTMEYHPRFQELIRRNRGIIWKKTINMGECLTDAENSKKLIPRGRNDRVCLG